MPEQIWFLIARTLSGEASAEEQQELQIILQKDEQLQQKFDLISRIWAAKQENLQQEDNSEAKSIVSLIIYKSETENGYETVPLVKRHIKWRKVFIAAASVLIVVSAGWLWFSNISSSPVNKKQGILEAHRGSRTSALLPDGSTVWLNAGSKLYYENDFTGATREVRLEGEAFFDIVKQPNHPFIVHTAGIDIKVVGTAFNVKSYPEDKTVETTLYRGSVKVFRHEESEKGAIHLKPNEKLSLLKEAAIVPENLSQATTTLSPDKVIPAIPTIAHIDSTKKENERIETAWVYNRLEFRGDNFEELAKKLERWYNVKVVFNDEKVKQLSFVGSFEVETVDQAFMSLKTANSLFNYKISNQEIFVGSSK